jgi:hypothetical protein
MCKQQYPHIVHKEGIVRFSPEQAEFVRGVWWDGQRDYADDPVLGTELLRQYIRDLWLPASAAAVWLKGINVQLPPWLIPSAEDVSTGKPKPDIPRTDYRAADAPLVAEMHSMIVDGRAKNLTDAARAVVHKACGNAKPASKVVRLVRHYRQRMPMS